MAHLQLRAQTLALEKQLCDTKKDSQQMVAALQQTMGDKVTSLRDELTDAQLQCQRMMNWGIRVMCTRHSFMLMRETWAAWKKMTWQGRDSSTREHQIQQLAARFLRNRCHRAFHAWFAQLNTTKLAREEAERVYRRVMHEQLVACFGAWQDIAVGVCARETLARAVSFKRTSLLRGVLRRWTACMHASKSQARLCDWMAARVVQRQLASAFFLWYQLLLDHNAAASTMNLRLQMKQKAACFTAWRSASCDRADESEAGILDDDLIAARMCKRIRRIVFGGWRRTAARKARNRKVLLRRYDVIAWRLQRTVIAEWRSAVLRKRRGRRIVERCCLQRQHRCMRVVFNAWRGAQEGSCTPLIQLEQRLTRRCVS
jgi:hypothetical protein